MDCIGIYIDDHTQRAIFNTKLALSHSENIIIHNRWIEDPEELRQKVQAGLQEDFPYVVVKFWDKEAELVIEGIPDFDYHLLICQEAPIYSGRQH